MRIKIRFATVRDAARGGSQQARTRGKFEQKQVRDAARGEIVASEGPR